MASNKRSVTPAAGSGSVDFMLRTAMERQSGNKRPIKPKLVDDSLLGDDSDDSDFHLEEQDSASGSDASDDSNSSGGSASGSESDDADSDESEGQPNKSSKKSTLRETLKKLAEESPGFHPPGKSKAKKKKKPAKGKKTTPAGVTEKKPAKKNGKPLKTKKKDEKPAAATRNEKKKKSNPYAGSIMDRVFKASTAMREIRSDIDLNRKICSFCLGEKSDESNEIVECDSCKITVHEGCYGLSDSLSMSSGSGSSSATEPWFCDFCKNPDNRCRCALCPNPGGLLKATAEEQFVHLVCAHYTPGVMSGYDNKTHLQKISYGKWGQKPCTLCSSVRFGNTGVTVKCDAGMCKSYVHISCAQKFGLLSDPSLYVGNDEADPFFASCKLHGHKDQAKQRATLFKVLQEQIRIKREKSVVGNLTPAVRQSQGRVHEKLEKIRARVAAKRIQVLSDRNSTSLIPTSVNGGSPFRPGCVQLQKRKPRNLKTCSYSVSSFLKKIENMGEDITSLELEEKHERIVANIKKRWNVNPSLTVEFTAYYFDREARIEALSQQCQELVKENEDLNDRQIALNTVLENEAVDHMEIMDDTLTMDSTLSKLKNILKVLDPENKSISTSAVLKGLPPRAKSPVRKTPSLPQPKGIGKTKRSATTGLELKKKAPVHLSRPSITADRLTVHVCALCKKSDQQHLITNCDHCNKNFHLGCLDPPLTRMPRRSRLVGWMCSDCCDEESENEEEVVVDTEAPRSLRGRTQLKRPEKYRGYEESEDDVVILKENPSKAHVPSPKPSPQQLLSKPSPQLPVVPVPPLPVKTGQDVRLKLEALQQSPIKTGAAPIQYYTLTTGKKTNQSPGEPASSFSPPVAKKMKTSVPAPSPKASNSKAVSKKSTLPIVSPGNRFVPILPKPEVGIKEEKLSPKTTMSNKGKGKSTQSGTRSLLKSPLPQFPAINLVISDSNHTGDLTETGTPPVSKKLKIVLSPVNSDHGGKNGLGDSRNSHLVTTGLLSPSPHPGQGKKAAATPTSKLTPPPEEEESPKSQGRQRKPSARTKKVADKDKSYFNSLNMSGQIAVAINYNNYATGSGVVGKCSICEKTEDKKNLVTCDDCNVEFHFTCVPPYMPYNPKRRGYKWVCERCANSSDEEGNIGEIRENVSRISH